MKNPFVLFIACVAMPHGAVIAQDRPASPGSAPSKPEFTEAVLRLQLFLDENLFGPGKLDGIPGEFTLKALQRYQLAHGMQQSSSLEEHQIDLATNVPELYTSYTIREEDLTYIGQVPGKPSQQSLKKYLPYESLLELVSERFHCAASLLRLINQVPSDSLPGEGETGGQREAVNLDSLKPGDVVQVPNVAPFLIEEMKPVPSLPEVPEFRSRIIRIDTRERMLDLHESDGGPLLASFPITPGSGHLATPPGTWKIIGISEMPTFRWDASVLEYGVRSDQFYHLPIGPNNPVGVMWIGLNKPGIGIHGTNHPDTIGRAASHGCMRTANWDAARLGKLVTKGMTVIIEGPLADPRPTPRATRPAAPARKPWNWWMRQG